MNVSSICFLVFLILTINLTHNVQAAKFIRNAQTLTCLDLTSTSSCAPATLNSCPTDRFLKFSDSLKWDLIPVNSSEVIIRSNNSLSCLSFTSNGTEICPCDDGVSQRWKLSNNTISSSVDGGCLSLVDSQISVEKCQSGVNSMSWKAYHVAPDTVNLYTKTDFADKPSKLLVNNTYNSNSLPTEIFSSPFSIEVPPGFELVVDRGNNNVETFDSDVAQMPSIDSTTMLFVRLKPGVIIYEHPGYFSASEFVQVDSQVPSNSFPIGSVLVPEGFRGVVWSNSDFTGDNLGLFEPIANFTGVSLITKEDFAASLDISFNTCNLECGSGGICSDKGICSCKLNFTGEKCEQCSKGFFGPDCQQCKCTGNKGVCDDGITGTGECKCNPEFVGDNCDRCGPGFFGTNCTECKCGSGTCDPQGICSCTAGFVLDKNQCTQCKKGYFMSGSDCKACPPGCDACDENEICTECVPELNLSNGKCLRKDSCPSGQFSNGTQPCTPCDSSCATCFGEGREKCLSCGDLNHYLEGSCVPLKNLSAIDGRCEFLVANQTFFVDNEKNLCEACPSSCLDCFIPNFSETSSAENMQCSSCIPGFSFDDGKCVKNCSEGKYSDANFECQVCDKSCASCSGLGADQCIKCSDKNFFSSNGTCSQNSCSPGFVAIDTVCTKCHTDCLECSGTEINQCTKCPPNRPMLHDGQCIEVCPMGTYGDENGTCQKCDAECSTCVGPRADQCLGCSDQNKVLFDGSCSGSCPAGSELNKFERICQNLDNGEIIPPVKVLNNQENQENPIKSIKLEWWHILLIAVGSLSFLIAIVLLVRCINVKKRKKKTKEFGDRIDENIVAQNLKNMLRASRGMPSQPEMSYGPRSTLKDVEFEDPIAPPAYNNKEGESYWKKQQMRKKHMSITSEDYNNWKIAKNNKDWDGFDIVTQENFNKAEYSGNPSGSRNDRNTIPPSNYEKYDWV